MPQKGDRTGGKGIPESLREAIEGAFAATERTRGRASELSGRTIDRAQDLVDQMSRRGHEARDTLEGMRLVAKDELRAIEERLERLTRRVDELERDAAREKD